MSSSEDLHPLVKYFVTYRGTPENAKKDLLQLIQNEEQVEQAYKDFLKLTGRRKFLNPPPMLVGNKDTENGWYLGADSYPDALFWPKLKSYLANVKQWSPNAIESVHSASDRIVAWLETPYAARIKTRGLVVGYVQSGKTANFTAVIAKAADAGYRFFIVLSGTKKSLRQQTQQRLETELVALNDDVWYSPTATHDFSPVMMGNPNYFLSDKKHDKVLCVVKKNVAILRKLINWLKTATPEVLRLCPFLIIDDEADEASPNTARNQINSDPETRDRTATNARLVELLDLLPKAAYVGYTATPFANVFIDPIYPGDLYPGDFIVSLPKPENHFGTEEIFGRERLLDDETDEEFQGIDMVRIIPNDEVPHLRNRYLDHDFIPNVTPSLKEAIHYFWLACAARYTRKQENQHSTMLVHTTQLAAVHNNTRTLIDNYRSSFLRAFIGNSRSMVLSELEGLWVREQESVPPKDMEAVAVTFQELLPYLETVIRHTEIISENYLSEYRLSYDGVGKIQIVIGGNTLSRGLTLEGLIVSFFVRTAKAYDTLLQMGRWFGYRPNYGDLPRIWMTGELRDHFFDLATIEEEIRRDIKIYDQQGITPREFGIRIRTHPDLTITAPLKMQHVVNASISYDDETQQTILFHEKSYQWLNQNVESTSDLVADIEKISAQHHSFNGHHIFYQVPVMRILSFFASYNFHENGRAISFKLLRDYIRDQNQFGLLQQWNVVLRGVVTGRDKETRETIQLGNFDVPLLQRAKRKSSPEGSAHIGVLMSKGDTGADMLVDRKALKGLAENEIKSMRNQEFIGTGLLVIYPILRNSQPGKGVKVKEALDAPQHIIGLGIVFPPAAEQSRGEQSYAMVDPRLLDNSDFEPEEEEDEEA